ncbi:MAG: SpoVA/SpoVAEb family sporulation membrane protein [Eubacteriales bacterium]|nr:SpoVA/SpoVAEb family sporulation membrane protein [Eubacteriales bacterium]
MLECKGESITQGSCAKMFTIAGPVIVYGVSTSVIYGIIFVLCRAFRTFLPTS